MNFARTQLKTVTTKPHLRRSLSLTASRDARKKNSCDEVDCCGNPINVRPKPTMYVERSCEACSFITWKPKIPILESAPPLADVRKKPFKKAHCYAGMKFVEKTLEEIKKEAAECQKRCAAKPVCPPPPLPPPPKKVDCGQIMIPAPDWDINIKGPNAKDPNDCDC